VMAALTQTPTGPQSTATIAINSAREPRARVPPRAGRLPSRTAPRGHHRRGAAPRRRPRATALGRAPALARVRPHGPRARPARVPQRPLPPERLPLAPGHLPGPRLRPGFATDLPLEGRHKLQISVFSDNAGTATTSLLADARPSETTPTLQLA
jgi:hypothetical protein